MITELQLTEIRNYLLSKKLPIDILIEVNDHFVSQITDFQGEENLNFEEAFDKVKLSWKEELIPYWKGDWDLQDRNNLVRNLEKNIFKEINKKFLTFLLLTIIVFFLLSHFLGIKNFKISFIIISTFILFFPISNFVLKYKDFNLWRKYQNQTLTLYQQYTFLNISAAYFIFRLVFDGENVAQYLFDFFYSPNFKNLLQGFIITFILYYISFITFYSQKIYLKQIKKVKPFLKYL